MLQQRHSCQRLAVRFVDLYCQRFLVPDNCCFVTFKPFETSVRQFSGKIVKIRQPERFDGLWAETQEFAEACVHGSPHDPSSASWTEHGNRDHGLKIG